MMKLNAVILKHGREASLSRNHHWVFSGAIHGKEGVMEEGEIIQVRSSMGVVLGYGHYHDASIAVRILSFGDLPIDQNFWNEKIQRAWEVRRKLSLIDNDITNAYRLVHGEGDGLPGLIIDIYQDHAVVQCHTLGMYRNIEYIRLALEKVYDQKLKSIYNKSKESLDSQSPDIKNSFLSGHSQDTIIKENQHLFHVDWVTGQKTGFFLDQRDNRQLLGSLCRNQSVLNLFSYSGGFSVYALKNGASQVVSVDVSNKAIELVNKNVSLLSDELQAKHVSVCTQVNQYLNDCDLYDIVICDPPAFAKSLNKRHQALIGYKNLNNKAISKVKAGGFLFTFSCSQVMDRELFSQTILSAGLESGRKIRILKHLQQGADHPVNLYHPEGSYLKGLLLYLED